MNGLTISADEAHSIAIRALSFVASDAALLPRFLALTGIEGHQIRQAAAEPGFLGGVLGFILAHEPTLMAFAESTGTAPQAVMAAMRLLPAGDDGWMGST